MTSKRSVLAASFCAVALAAAGCGGDDENNDALSYEETGTEIGQICDSVNIEDAGLTGQADNDADKLGPVIDDFEAAIQELRDLDVNEELAQDRDAFAENAEEQVELIKEAEGFAQEGNQKEYRATLDSGESLDAESDAIASRLGAEACIN